jgi:hypothetical protein
MIYFSLLIPYFSDIFTVGSSFVLVDAGSVYICSGLHEQSDNLKF